jgi:hypothetical protein
LTHLTQITEWPLNQGRSLGEERYLYIKIVVIGAVGICGKKVKVLVRTGKLSFLSVDKPVESVDNRWIKTIVDLSLPTASPKKELSHPGYTRKRAFIHSYPHLFHIWG